MPSEWVVESTIIWRKPSTSSYQLRLLKDWSLLRHSCWTDHCTDTCPNFMGKWWQRSRFLTHSVLKGKCGCHESTTTANQRRHLVLVQLVPHLLRLAVDHDSFYVLAVQFEGTVLQQSMLLQSIVFAQAVYLLNCRELVKPALNRQLFANRALFVSLSLLIVLQAAIFLTPLGHQLLGIGSLTLMQQLSIAANGALLSQSLRVRNLLRISCKDGKAAPVKQ